MRRQSQRTRGYADRLQHRTDEIDIGGIHHGEYRAGTKDKQSRDDRRRDHYGFGDKSCGVATFSGENGHVLEAAKGEEGKLAQNVEVE